ncbi:glutamate dehydrogenase [Methylococcus capsulatus]|jgi:glutamate dehydrogenase (NAD(P)+)|uniref:Glutamate dehydrogenase n=1 Tax=Methylococcus capsulatus TaxID=414 RepID=A0AA35XSL0_METCP|nr:Glu/Leu/Phe/Val dehydrogenase dimerization domain-containing protein [Methylococcus capsulatus]CAI8730459.1 Glutamate dehydrogenase [Methylococcus capsulatus]
MTDIFDPSDEFGPARIIQVREPSVGLRATVIIDNVALGPAIGGLRIASAGSTADGCRLARTMTLKSAAADLPHGGGVAMLHPAPGSPENACRQHRVRALACALRSEDQFIFAPDMGSGETAMAWIRDENGRAVGLPRELGGIALSRIGAAGWGLYHATEVALRYCGFKLEDARVVIQGFGTVGQNTARYLVENGAVVVGIADSGGTLHHPRGLDIAELVAIKAKGGSVVDSSEGERLAPDAAVDLDCDIWIPAAGSDVITPDNAARLKARLVVEAADASLAPAAERYLHEKGIICVPDFIANAGGLIGAAMECRGANKTQVLSAIKEKIRRNTEKVLQSVETDGTLPREAAVRLAMKPIVKAMSYRRWSGLSAD